MCPPMIRSFAGLTGLADLPDLPARVDLPDGAGLLGLIDLAPIDLAPAFSADGFGLGERFIGPSITGRRKRTSASGFRGKPNRSGRRTDARTLQSPEDARPRRTVVSRSQTAMNENAIPSQDDFEDQAHR